MRKYEVLFEHPDLPYVAGEEIELDDYSKECALVEGGYLKSMNYHSAEGET